MGVFDLFSKRQRRDKGEMPDVYKYDDLPNPLRVQIIQIIQDAVGIDQYAYGLFDFINTTLCREFGVFRLANNQKTIVDSIFTFFLQEESVDKTLDVVELFFRVINTNVRNDHKNQRNGGRKITPDEAIAELNARFKEHGVGFQFESNKLIRMDSEYLHAEAVKPALVLLSKEGFEGANEEFLHALEHYRHGRFKESLVDSLKSLESTMKSICTLRGWSYKSEDTASKLISTCIENGLLPSFLEPQYNSLRTLLESGTPTIRNKRGGHGQGPKPIIIPEYLTRYAINLTASSILFLVESNNEKR
jgi:hypothetical protein